MKVQGQVDAALAHEALSAVDDPIEALGRLAVEALALKDALAQRVNALNEMRYVAAGAGTEQLRVEVALYERALDRSAKFLDLLAKNNFTERRVELEQAKASIVIAAFRSAIDGLALVPADRDRVIRGFLESLGRAPDEGGEVVRGELGE